MKIWKLEIYILDVYQLIYVIIWIFLPLIVGYHFNSLLKIKLMSLVMQIIAGNNLIVTPRSGNSLIELDEFIS